MTKGGKMTTIVEELEKKIALYEDMIESWSCRFENMRSWKESLEKQAEDYNLLLDPIVWLVAGNSFLFGVLAALLVIFAK